MIPALVILGNPVPWPVLPPGIYDADLGEIEVRFGTTPHRRALLKGFERVATNLWAAGCTSVFLDGSFATDSTHPGDFDGCWDPGGVDLGKIDQLLIDPLDLVNKRLGQKAKYLGEMFPSTISATPVGLTFLEFFQLEKFSGKAKGILRVKPSRLS